jgi:hypothetical protein
LLLGAAFSVSVELPRSLRQLLPSLRQLLLGPAAATGHEVNGWQLTLSLMQDKDDRLTPERTCGVGARSAVLAGFCEVASADFVRSLPQLTDEDPERCSLGTEDTFGIGLDFGDLEPSFGLDLTKGLIHLSTEQEDQNKRLNMKGHFFQPCT